MGNWTETFTELLPPSARRRTRARSPHCFGSAWPVSGHALPCSPTAAAPLAVHRRGSRHKLYAWLWYGHPPPGSSTCVAMRAGSMAYATHGFSPLRLSLRWPFFRRPRISILIGMTLAVARRNSGEPTETKGGRGSGQLAPRRRRPSLLRPLASVDRAVRHGAGTLGGVPGDAPGTAPEQHGQAVSEPAAERLPDPPPGGEAGTRSGRRPRPAPAGRAHPAGGVAPGHAGGRTRNPAVDGGRQNLRPGRWRRPKGAGWGGVLRAGYPPGGGCL